MSAATSTGRNRKITRRVNRRPAKKGLLSSHLVSAGEPAGAADAATSHPVHCDSCQGDPNVEHREFRLLSHQPGRRPTPEC